MINLFFANRTKIYVALLALVLFSYMLSYALNSIGVFLLLIFFFLDTKSNLAAKIKALKCNKMVVLYIIFFIIQCIGLIYSENVGFGVKRITVQIPLIFLPGILLTEPMDYKFFYKMLNLLKYWIALVFAYFIGLHVFVNHDPLNTFVLYIIKERLGISQFYIVFIVLVPILFCLKKIELKQQRLENVIFLGFFIFCVLLLGNQTSLLMLLLICFIKFLVLFKSANWFLRISVFAISVGLLFTLAYFTTGLKKKIDITLKTTDFDIETIITKNSVTFTKNTLEHRILINYLTWKEIKLSFPFGVGTGDYQDVLNENYEQVHFKLGIKQGFNNHNQYMSEFLKTGLLGGLCFIVLILFLIYNSRLSDNFYVYLILFFSIGCLFESYLDRQHGVVIFAFMLPLFFKSENLKSTLL